MGIELVPLPPQKGGDKLGYESEAFAIYDTMKYIKPEVHTLCVGNAFGESAMLLAAGTPVRPECLSSLMSLYTRMMSRWSLGKVTYVKDPTFDIKSCACSGQARRSPFINNHASAAHAEIRADAGLRHRHLQE